VTGVDPSHPTVTGLDVVLTRNAGGQATPDQLDSLVQRLDAVVTTQLHGLVLACATASRPWPWIRSPGQAR
jgi:hypothetical protein